MKQKDKEIIQHLRTGKRLNISKIARQLNLPISTVNDKIKRIEARYVIKRSSLLDYAKLGYLAHAKLAVKIDPDKKDEFIEFLKQQDCVNSIYHINSSFDFLVEVVCKNLVELKEWVNNIEKKFEVGLTLFNILKTEVKEEFLSK